ncbi:MAG: hypothetical protein A2W00_03820 [Candidatus Eisenbacteria bacterium RBG_16_71_46]|nr:MAG: hypothetical protein A2W00_03820 [Candidatus Eisenbacteria bacterium RBG_16_71_46]
MTAPRFDHLEWSKSQADHYRHNLANSAVPEPDLAALGLPHQAGLPRDGYALLPEVERALGERLAAPGARVLVTAGASEANACVFGGLLAPGEEVLAEIPGYEPHREAARLFGAAVRGFPRPLPLGRSPQASLVEAIESALGPATRLVVLSDLHNPSGAALEDSDLEALDDLAARRDVWILCDEIFRDASDRPAGTLASRGPRWVATGSLTKCYGLGGLRIGWVAADRDVLARCAGAQNGLSVQPALPSLALTLALVPHLDTLRARARRILAANRGQWQSLVTRQEACEVSRAPHGTTTWCAFPAEGAGDAFARFAAERFDLALPPGRFFGDSRGVRVALCDEPARFERSLEVFEHALSAFVAAGTATREYA